MNELFLQTSRRNQTAHVVLRIEQRSSDPRCWWSSHHPGLRGSSQKSDEAAFRLTTYRNRMYQHSTRWSTSCQSLSLALQHTHMHQPRPRDSRLFCQEETVLLMILSSGSKRTFKKRWWYEGRKQIGCGRHSGSSSCLWTPLQTTLPAWLVSYFRCMRSINQVHEHLNQLTHTHIESVFILLADCLYKSLCPSYEMCSK